MWRSASSFSHSSSAARPDWEKPIEDAEERGENVCEYRGDREEVLPASSPRL